ncbi:hypothetical protein NDN01_25030 [Sphingomonas sp. QA11]|uniref:hypothetical protein n=1 Tax=Sphingomonas sp. QA11 TaxID=2950605 RepID=UPI00234A0E54|nr:hypothetical protein [Sphingomonas sp. QA11]WCM27208.1 hypothetical protein NDN01_25030 [Sphingomonas sp. QA11]
MHLPLGAMLLILLPCGTGYATGGGAAQHAGIDRKSEDVMRTLRTILRCIPEKDANNICVAHNSGLQVVFVNTRPGTGEVTSVETLVRTGGENLRDIRRATPSVTRLVSFLVPDANRAVKSALSAIARTKKTECVQLLRYAHYEIEIERVMPADVEGLFAALIVRKLPSGRSGSAATSGGWKQWIATEKCHAR